jgi:F-type H+-transporting ATPase subunit delta
MTSRTAALRYARALFDVAVKEAADLQEVEQDLTAFAELFSRHDTLRKVLLNPAVPAPRKRATVAELLERMKVSPVVGKLMTLLAERDRLMLVPELLDAYRQRLLDHRHIVRAEVTTAAALPADRTEAIGQSLAAATGRQVMLATRVDPSIIGGMVTRIGSTVYDGSLIGQLARMKKKLGGDGIQQRWT